MKTLPKSRLLQFVERALVLARRAVARFSTRYSRKRFTLRQHVVLLCLKVKKTTTYRDLVVGCLFRPADKKSTLRGGECLSSKQSKADCTLLTVMRQRRKWFYMPC